MLPISILQLGGIVLHELGDRVFHLKSLFGCLKANSPDKVYIEFKILIAVFAYLVLRKGRLYIYGAINCKESYLHTSQTTCCFLFMPHGSASSQWKYDLICSFPQNTNKFILVINAILLPYNSFIK